MWTSTKNLNRHDADMGYPMTNKILQLICEMTALTIIKAKKGSNGYS